MRLCVHMYTRPLLCTIFIIYFVRLKCSTHNNRSVNTCIFFSLQNSPIAQACSQMITGIRIYFALPFHHRPRETRGLGSQAVENSIRAHKHTHSHTKLELVSYRYNIRYHFAAAGLRSFLLWLAAVCIRESNEKLSTISYK